jgi:hypothetical protein
MKRLFTLTICTFLAISCSQRYNATSMSKGSAMTFGVGTQAALDAANQRILHFKEELLQNGFHQVSLSVSDLRDEYILEGRYGSLKDLRVKLSTGKKLQSDAPEVAGGIDAFVKDEQADREFQELYKKVVYVVTGDFQIVQSVAK